MKQTLTALLLALSFLIGCSEDNCLNNQIEIPVYSLDTFGLVSTTPEYNWISRSFEIDIPLSKIKLQFTGQTNMDNDADNIRGLSIYVTSDTNALLSTDYSDYNSIDSSYSYLIEAPTNNIHLKFTVSIPYVDPNCITQYGVAYLRFYKINIYKVN